MTLLRKVFPGISIILAIFLFTGIAYAKIDNHAWDYLKGKKYKQAEKAFIEIIELSPRETEGYLGLGKTYQEQNQHDRALECFNKVLKINPADNTVHESIGEVYESQGDYRKAIESYKKAVKIEPKNIHIYYKISLSYRKQKNFSEAMKWAKEAIRMDPKSGMGYSSLGLIYEDMGNYKEALRYFQDSVKADPNEDRGYIGIGNVYMRQNQYEEAIKWYSKVNTSEEVICAYEGLGLAYRKLAVPSLAEEQFLTIVRLHPYNAIGYHDLADYYLNIGQLDKAADNIEKAISLATNKDELRGILETKGFIAIRRDDYLLAEQLFMDLIKWHGVNCVTLTGLGYIANSKEDYRSARKYFEEALKQPDIVSPDTSPINDRANIFLGLALTNANERKYKEALSYYEQVLKEEPIVIYALIGLGDVYRQLGEPDKADAYFKRAAAINPEFLAKKDKSTRGTAK